MDQEQISFDLVGRPLGEDIYSEQGILLLKKGTILKETHILLLQKYRFGKIVAIDSNASTPLYFWNESPSKEPYESFPVLLKETFHKIINDVELDFNDFRKRYHSLIDLALCDLSILKVLQFKVKTGEKFYQHSINVGIFSSLIANLLGYDRKDCLLISEMGLFHNIGMLCLADAQNDATDIIKEETLENAQKHTELGYKVLKSMPNIDPAIPLAALHHHERLNGSGFPSQRKSGGIPLCAQIVSVSDAFSHILMNSETSDKSAMMNGANEIMEAAHNNLLNPGIVVPFVQYIMRQNLHEKVRLSNGKEGEIIFIHDNEPLQPLVKTKDGYVNLLKDSSLRIEGIIEDYSDIVLK